MLRAAADTQWGSQVALVASLLKNRNVVEQAILKLRAQKFAFKGSQLMWIWEMDWWSTLEGIHVAVSPVQELLEKVQADGVSLGRAVESLHEMLDKIAPAVRRIAPGDAVRAAAIVAQRGPQFFSPYSSLGQYFHRRCRGACLHEELRSNALSGLSPA